MNTGVLDAKKAELKVLTADAVRRLYREECSFEIIRPRRAEDGCLSAAAPLVLGPVLRRPPTEIAAEIAAEIKMPAGEFVRAGGKGYVNFFIKLDFMLNALDREFTLPEFEVPPLSDPEFMYNYIPARLSAVLKNRKLCCDADEAMELLTSPEEQRLLWAIFCGSGKELREAALLFYDKTGLNSGYPPLDKARCILLGNALCAMNRKG